MTTQVAKPCPFCNGSFVTPSSTPDGRVLLQCRNTECEATGPASDNYTKAVKRWNRRPSCVLDLAKSSVAESAS